MHPQLTFFTTQQDFRKWLEEYHLSATELYAGFYKVGSGKPSMTWSEAVDEALCFGWIDGVRKSVDKESYYIRFTPRKPKSIWSAVNIRKIEELTQKGLMHPAGHKAYSLRQEHRSKVYSYENEAVALSPEFEKKFKTNKKAWQYFQSMPPSYIKVASRWVMSAKQDATRLKRLDTLISDSEAERKIKPLSYGRR